MQFASFTSTAVKDRVNEAAGAIQQRMHRIVFLKMLETVVRRR